MRTSWMGLQLVLLSCVLLLAVVAVEGKHGKKKESSSEEECPCQKRHCCVVECCEKKHHHKDEESCKKKHHHGKVDAGKKPSRKKHPHLKKSEEATEDSSDMYKRWAKEEQKRMTELAAQTSEAVPHYRKEEAIAHINQGSVGTYYKNMEDQVEYQKAIGVMIYVKMVLGKTNCNKTKEQEAAGVEYSRAYMEKEGCQLLPEFKQEKRNCTFKIFLDMRSEKKAVVSERCTLLPRIKKLHKAFKGPRA